MGSSTSLLNEIVTQVLDKAKSRQKGRVTDEVTNVTKQIDAEAIDTHILEQAKENQKGRVSSNDTNVATNNFTTKQSVTQVLTKAKQHQKGRVTSDVTNVTK